MQRSRTIIFFLFISLSYTACTEDKDKAPDVSDVMVETNFVRFDSILYAMNSPDQLQQVMNAYPAYTSLYFNQILHLKPSRSVDSLYVQVRDMVDSEAFQVIGQKGHNQYDIIDDIKRDWIKSMKYYKHYFNPETVPDFYTTVTEFGFGSFIFPIDDKKDGVGVSVDLFLGDSINYPAMAKMDASFSAYNSRSFNRDHLVKKAVDAVIDDLLPMPRGTEFLPQLIREGKKYYISDKLLPYVSDTVIWEYSTEQWKWVQENEWNIYSFLVSNELFYSTNRAKYIRLITAAPSTPDMPPEAPGRSVIYIAYKIVERYAERNPSMSLQEIIDTDANTIFQGAKYKPER